MLDDATYRQWTAEFNPSGSYYEGSWEKGSKIRFLGPDENGELSGMVSEIADNRPYEFLSILHLGVINKGVEDTTSEAIKGWAGAYENYTFRDADGQTELMVEMNVDPEHAEMFEDMWPRGLEKLKELAESS